MNNNRTIALWLVAVSALIIVMIVFGGLVRLTESGLSIVEWDVITGVVPPLSDAGWASAFSQYRQTPEYQQLNQGMSVEDFRFIYYMEWGHRLLGRVAGLAFVVPLLLFLLRGQIMPARVPAFAMIGLLFAAQGVLGWVMVRSGLVDQPQVSHVRLTLHLGVALLLLAACVWLALGYLFGQPQPTQPRVSRQLRRLVLLLLAVLAVQMLGGGLVAGLDAGLVSDTFPRMFGQWLPSGLWRLDPWIANHVNNPATVHFQHRWFAFVVVAVAAALARQTRRELVPMYLRPATAGVLHLSLAQLVLGVALVVTHMPVWLASLHQALAVAILVMALLAAHRSYRA